MWQAASEKRSTTTALMGLGAGRAVARGNWKAASMMGGHGGFFFWDVFFAWLSCRNELIIAWKTVGGSIGPSFAVLLSLSVTQATGSNGKARQVGQAALTDALR